MNRPTRFHWTGDVAHYVDRPNVRLIEHVHVGRFGGNSASGQSKNEDGCLVWVNPEKGWEFAVVLDAHESSDSANAVIALIKQHETRLIERLDDSFTSSYFAAFEQTVLGLFQSPAFLATCAALQGETACLLVVRKAQYVWWLSIGDCVCFLFHDELAAFHQYQLNQRQFYEWVGRVNTFNQPIPTYSRGVRELRAGTNRLLLVTDGILECPGEPFARPEQLYHALSGDLAQGVRELLETIQRHGVRDSTTLVAWDCVNDLPATFAGNQSKSKT